MKYFITTLLLFSSCYEYKPLAWFEKSSKGYSYKYCKVLIENGMMMKKQSYQQCTTPPEDCIFAMKPDEIEACQFVGFED